MQRIVRFRPIVMSVSRSYVRIIFPADGARQTCLCNASNALTLVHSGFCVRCSSDAYMRSFRVERVCPSRTSTQAG